MAVPLEYDGLYTLRIMPSLVQRNTLLLYPADSVGNLLKRPAIDEEDDDPVYSVELQGSDGISRPEPAATSSNATTASPTIDVQTITAIHLLDPLTDTVLATATSLTPNKYRQIQLHNPPITVETKNKTFISFEWIFHFEGTSFAWSRSRDTLSTSNTGYTCKISRKPDPDIEVAVYKSTKKANVLQIQDYNLDRFSFEDRKGVKLLLVLTLFTLVYGEKLDEGVRKPSYPVLNAEPDQQENGVISSIKPRQPPPRRVSEDVETAAPNEIIVSAHLSDKAYVDHCLGLLRDPTLIFLCLVAESAETVPRAISISSEIKRVVLKHQKSTPSSSAKPIKASPNPDSTIEDEIMTFIDYPGRERRSSNSKEDKVPPNRIKVYLSRIPLEEFTPKQPDPSDAGKDSRNDFRDASPMPLGKSRPHKRSSGPGGSGNAIRPPLPPKVKANTGVEKESSSKKSFWARAVS